MNKKPHNKATEWFNELYKENRENHDAIPWASLAVNPLLKEHLKDEKYEHKGKALVIGCGLGDDAKALSIAGYDVLAIDISEVALEIAKERCDGFNILFEKQDIFEMPQKYKGYFDFVFEAFTIQSLPIEFRESMIESITQTLAPNAHLLVVAHQREHEFNGPPWPLNKDEIDFFKRHSLAEVSFHIHKQESKISNTRFKVLYKK